MIISYNISLAIDNPHAVAVDIGLANNPIPEKLNVVELEVVALITKVSNDFNIAVSVLYFYISFSVSCFNL